MDLLSHLDAFVAVAEQRNFTRGADALGIPQPLLSRRIKSLERAWGGQLFDRSRQQIQLTAFGALLVPYAQDILHRTRHLHTVVTRAGPSLVCTIGVPPDCPPSALARIIRAAADDGVVVNVREASPQGREAALADGTLGIAMLRASAETAPVTVRLGVAAAAPWSRRHLHLDSLRPRRTSPGGGPPTLLITPEDALELFTDRLARGIARAGLPDETVRCASSTAAAAAEALAGRALLLCDRLLADRHGLSWVPLAERALDRGYRIGVAGVATLDDEQIDRLTPLLSRAVGSDTTLDEDEVDQRTRLTASG